MDKIRLSILKNEWNDDVKSKLKNSIENKTLNTKRKTVFLN